VGELLAEVYAGEYGAGIRWLNQVDPELADRVRREGPAASA
jgi:hypothetical protein